MLNRIIHHAPVIQIKGGIISGGSILNYSAWNIASVDTASYLKSRGPAYSIEDLALQDFHDF